uniref:TIGR03087 family PEP-CTERM/XrtA system glycosyltransferase n=1 Tax=Ningiella ruwaisensis TaxID=2364274 RepID=UPI0010A03CBC|nr:TIGR03087 family PEP-CTERM/XrtA system glycosyltransferase [Ningiella ruwaisensis]
MANIVVIAHRVPYPPNKGEKLRTFHQLEHLQKKGHRLEVLVPCESSEDEFLAKQLAEHLNIKVSTFRLAPTIIRRLRALVSGRSISEVNFYSKDLAKALKEDVHNVDVVYCTASSLAPYVFSQQLDLSHRCLMDFMDVDSDKWAQFANSASFPLRYIYRRESKLVQKLERDVLQKFDASFVIAHEEKALMQRLFKHTDTLHVLANGIDKSLFFPPIEKPKQDDQRFHFFFAGVMDYKPNVDAVLWFTENCWPSIRQSIPNAHFTVAGMNPTSSIQQLSNQEGIEVTGFVNDIKPFFDRADVFVAPFLIARGVQNKVLQAMACAIPVLSTSRGLEGIAYEDGTHAISANTKEDFIDKALTFAKNKELRERIGQAALALINQTYTWESVLPPLYEQIAHEQKAKY